MLKLIHGKKDIRQREKEDKLSFLIERYQIMDDKMVEELVTNPKRPQKQQEDFISRLSFLRLKKCLYKYAKTDIKEMPLAELEKLILEFANVIQALMMLTPKLLEQTFPISKTYDGKKFDCLDYFTTKEALSQFDKNKSLVSVKDNLLEEELDKKTKNTLLLLLEYQNTDICKFNIFYSLLRSEHMKRTTGLSLTEKIIEEIPELRESCMTLHTANNGKKYLIDANGKSHKVTPSIPRNWKIIKNKK